MADDSFAFVIAISDYCGTETYMPVVRSKGLPQPDSTTIAMLEAMYNGGCRKSADFKQIASTNGLISMTGISIPSKNFLNSALS